MIETAKNIFFRIWYWYISTVDKKAQVTFMNYGYSSSHIDLELEEHDEKDRYSMQLYNYVATGIDIKGKDILEVGCGRGGGISFIKRYLEPKNATGIDLNKKAIDFCKKQYSEHCIDFYQGNAQELVFKENTFDVVINVESSHRYPQMNKFLDEVFRVLKPGGYLLFTDFRHEKDVEKLNMQFKNSGFEIIKEELITPNVLEALKLSSVEREKLIQSLAPKFLHGLGKKFAATEGTPTYNKFSENKFEYLSHILVKK
ncbi:MAG TPA: class I SAM-dependent methyltransferase [Bacteroidales bacterium]|jgi:ubiquinone/menaquinone biosynthesis C-methylase UbiE|nr:class I SAM-dependent methyltransferase [Bacteroidales bacterium]